MVAKLCREKLYMNFPDTCLRGIRKQNYITPEGKVTGTAFDPDKRTSATRSDGDYETSINWEDNEKVIEFCFKPHIKSGFDYGAVRLARNEIDRINEFPEKLNYLFYERDDPPSTSNPYHGSIVFKKGLSPQLIRVLAGSLAQRATSIIKIP